MENKQTTKSEINIGFCGVGAFGFALLKHLERKYLENSPTEQKANFFVFDNRPDFLNKINPAVKVANNIAEVVSWSDILVVAVNSSALPDVYQAIKQSNKQNIVLVNVAKALSADGDTYSIEAAQELSGLNYTYAAFVGGSIAKDLLAGSPLGMTMACANIEVANYLTTVFQSATLKVYPHTDLVGVELASALKNVVSLMGGLVEGLGLPFGSTTYMITSAVKEITNFAVKNYGAKPETFSMTSQHWGNDMWMSSTGDTRNRKFGKLIGSGKTDAEAFTELQTTTIESLYTLKGLAKTVGFGDLKITKELYDIFINKTKAPVTFIEFILNNKF